jgi:3-deoxy-D-manno-octulosonic-acid transferase
VHPLLSAAYRAAGAAATLAARLAPEGEGKVVRALRGRRDLAARLSAWGRTYRDRSRPLLWMHAPSVGEGLQARPLLELFRARRPDVQLAYTFYSPSAERFARGLDVDVADYLPFDTGRGAGQLLDALRPTALVYAKLDVWPILTAQAVARGVRVGMVSASLAPGSSRRGRVARALLHESYAALELVGAVSEDDAGRLEALGVRGQALQVTGDTRYDQVATRAAQVDRTSPLLAPLISARPTLVAGSTWPADEAVLLPAWTALRRTLSDARLIIAPHEPTDGHLAPIEAWANACGLSLARLGRDGESTADVVLVDRVGVLGELYALATAAFVGGGFHSAGLHSVLEPAAFGVPVAFGPRVRDARDAVLLTEAGGGLPVHDRDDAAGRLADWLGRTEAWRLAGERAREFVARNRGAAERSYALVASLLEPRG